MPNIYSEQLGYQKRKYNSTHELYYFYPHKNLINFNLEVSPTNEEGEITIKGIKPTIVKDFKQAFNYDVPKGIGPQYFRINIDKGLKDDFTFNFGTKVNWFEGKMFDNNFNLNTGKVISSFDISSNDAGKTYTAIYNNTGKFTAKKNFNWETPNKYQYKYFKLSPGEEKSFKYIQKETSSTLVDFEKGYTGEKVKIYVYYSEDNIDYDVTDRNI